MLRPAIIYKKDIEYEMKKLFYTDEMMLETGSLCNWIPEIVNDSDDCSIYQYAIIAKNGVLKGFIVFTVDWYSGSASRFGLISFKKGSVEVALAIREIFKKLTKEYKLHRIEWRMIGGNSIEKHYDKWCKKYNGRKLVLKDVFRDRKGVYRDDCIYEIIL